jgi:hypothetical protein
MKYPIFERLFCYTLLVFPILFLIFFNLFNYNIYNILYLPLTILISNPEYYFSTSNIMANNFLAWHINLLILAIFYIK